MMNAIHKAAIRMSVARTNAARGIRKHLRKRSRGQGLTEYCMAMAFACIIGAVMYHIFVDNGVAAGIVWSSWNVIWNFFNDLFNRLGGLF